MYSETEHMSLRTTVTNTTQYADGTKHADFLQVLGVSVHMVNMESTISALQNMLTNERRHIIIPVNPEMIIAAGRNPGFRDTLNQATLALPDGFGVKLAARLYGHSHVDRVAGIDTIEQLAAIASDRKLSVFLLGAATGVAEQAAARLREQHPGLEIAGTYAGSPHPDEENEICQRIISSRADILLVAYGAPRQELWLSRNIHKLPVRLAMCVGGSFDFLAGLTSRAPQWMQRSGIEWFYRLIQEPRRWRRMLALPKFAALVIIERILSLFPSKQS